MKKLSTVVRTKEGKKKTITVWLDNETAWRLQECGDERLIHEYIVEEYKTHLIERKETRRHQSLDMSIEQGCEFIDENSDVEQKIISLEEVSRLHKGLETLTDKQLKILNLHVLEGKTFNEIAKELEINIYTVYEHFTAAKKKLKKFLS